MGKLTEQFDHNDKKDLCPWRKPKGVTYGADATRESRRLASLLISLCLTPRLEASGEKGAYEYQHSPCYQLPPYPFF